MYEKEDSGYNLCGFYVKPRPRSRPKSMGELIRLLEVRLEELERRISLLEAVMDRRCGGGYGDLPESVPIKQDPSCVLMCLKTVTALVEGSP